MENVLNKKIGIIGGGQLGKMMILEAKRLGVYVVTLDPTPDCPSHSISDEHIVADFHDEAAIRALAEKVDVITYEFEHINAKALQKLEEEGHTIYPSVASLIDIQDKHRQKTKLLANDIPVPRFELMGEFNEIRWYAKNNGYPFMLKSCKGGYDGHGNYLVKDRVDLRAGFRALNGDIIPLMVEEFVDFEMEVSVIATRAISGEKVVYPIGRNLHKNSILDTTTVPADLSDETLENICNTAEKVLDIFEGVGTFCVEMFVSKDGKISINEVAPRVHNSGHYTIEGCRVNQFENHIRAILGLPLGDTGLCQGAVIMRNLLGEGEGRAEVCGIEEAYKNLGVNIHVYGKSHSKQGRKMGHYTVTADTLKAALEIDEKIKNIVKIKGNGEEI